MTELAAFRGIVRGHVMAPGNKAAAPEADCGGETDGDRRAQIY
jgi:hypothetical protein